MRDEVIRKALTEIDREGQVRTGQLKTVADKFLGKICTS